MAEVTIPRMLAELIGGTRRVAADGATVGEALDALTAAHPQLTVHLFDEDHRLRSHVRCFRNDRSAELTDPVGSSDRITVLQAVSGGSE
jgi:sulfur-carrier protein